MEKNKKKVILIGAAKLPDRPDKEAMELFSQADLIFALDGGLLYCIENNIKPDYVIGDFDSLSADKVNLLETYSKEQVLRLPKEKDDTDMLAAIKFAIEKGGNEFVIYGGLGGRLSHTVANIQCLMYLKMKNMTGVLMGDKTKVFLLQNETHTFNGTENGYLSVFSYSKESQGITLKNLKYELEDARLTNAFPLGVSNEFIGKEAEITVKEGTLLIVMDK